MENIFGGLLQFDGEKDLDTYLEKITKHDAFKLIELSVIYSQKSGLYNLSESHLLYKCLKKLNESQNNDVL